MPNPLLLDACIAINLVATGCSEDIATALDVCFLMASRAAIECSGLHVSQGEAFVRHQGASIGAAPLAKVLTLTRAEIDVYVALAREIDDGEAATIAIACSRSLKIATDDRKARRVAVDMGLDAPKGTTTILRHYTEAVNLNPKQITVVLQRVRDEASYVPRHTDQNFDWWQQSIGT